MAFPLVGDTMMRARRAEKLKGIPEYCADNDPGRTRTERDSDAPVGGQAVGIFACLTAAGYLGRHVVGRARPERHGKAIPTPRGSCPRTVLLRDEPWKRPTDADLDRFELYNLQDDVGVSRNLAEKHPERVQQKPVAMN
jgi:hypothetical protein